MKHKCPCIRQIQEVAIIVKTHRQDFKIYGSNIKVLSQVTCTWNTKALSLTIQKIWPKLKFIKSGSNFKVKVKNYGTIRIMVTYHYKVLVIRNTNLVPIKRSCHKEHTYEIWKPYLLPFKRYGQCKSFWKVGQTSRSQGKKNLIPIERYCHKEHTYEIWKPYHLPFKRYGQY
jgi:hypothetical protein